MLVGTWTAVVIYTVATSGGNSKYEKLCGSHIADISLLPWRDKKLKSLVDSKNCVRCKKYKTSVDSVRK
jgi:hypothetical protein